MATTKTKVCRVCGTEKPLYDFRLRKDTGRHRSECKQCESNRLRLRDTGWHTEEVEKAYLEQHGRCAICGCVLDVNSMSVMVCDHNHKTGKHRGLLCTNCNLGLGHFKEDIETLEGAISYLQRHNKN